MQWVMDFVRFSIINQLEMIGDEYLLSDHDVQRTEITGPQIQHALLASHVLGLESEPKRRARRLARRLRRTAEGLPCESRQSRTHRAREVFGPVSLHAHSLLQDARPRGGTARPPKYLL